VSAGRFEFRLERVRALRERSEQEATEHLAAAMAERARWAQRLADAASRLGDARASQLGAAGAVPSMGEMLAHQAFLERSEREHAAAELDLSRQDAEVDARRRALQHAARERQVLEQLKSKQAAAHRREAERRENEKLDELALSGFTRRRAA
jgi:flagellar FliJ protein